MSQITYDFRFDSIEILDVCFHDCVKDRLEDVLASSVPREDYVTIEDLQKAFGGISRYQVGRYLEQVGAKPFGELKNYRDDGSRERGVGKVVYKKEVVPLIREAANQMVDVASIKADALQFLLQNNALKN